MDYSERVERIVRKLLFARTHHDSARDTSYVVIGDKREMGLFHFGARWKIPRCSLTVKQMDSGQAKNRHYFSFVLISKICFIAMRAPRFGAITLLAWLFGLMVRLHAHMLAGFTACDIINRITPSNLCRN